MKYLEQLNFRAAVQKSTQLWISKVGPRQARHRTKYYVEPIPEHSGTRAILAIQDEDVSLLSAGDQALLVDELPARYVVAAPQRVRP